ncbi:LOW QUALITY PROTEIN: uncharacterized protein [Macrobrachium rosenbergii]|uniref:LOW QUALITY PROTEIN: uncharacterized protein n=1 Tax=Macrobrachium rosenbergii TaxID=79674 RepID=UPI0034D78585
MDILPSAMWWKDTMALAVGATLPTRSVLSSLWLLLLLNLLDQAPLAHSQGEQCGRPGRPVNGTVSASGRFYFPGERVAYKCLEGFVLFGADERTCQKNGTWSDEVPLCDFNLARGKRSLQSATLWSYAPEMAVDGNPDTCSFTPRGPDPRWWQVHLGHKFNVMSVGVTISPGSFQEFTIYVIELLTDNKALYKPCTTFKGVFQTHKALFKCNGGLGHPGQFVYIRDDRKEQEYFGLCEVEVFAFRERIPCGEPEVPVEGEAERQGENKALYSCRTGFRLEGDQILTCSSKGKWEGQTPRCTEAQCPPPDHVTHGFIEVDNHRGVYGYGTVATYSCNPGYYLKGNNTRTCDHTGRWTNESPFCQAVTCGPPPIFPHARHTLLNGSTHWNGIAVYTCNDGYRLHSDTGDTVTSCMDIGTWQVINVSCIPIESSVPSSGARRGDGRSLNFDLEAVPSSEPEGTQGLVVALAVVAGLLTAAMLVVGALLARRHILSGPGSLRSLIRSTPTKEATLYGAMIGPHPDVTTVGNTSVPGNRGNNGLLPEEGQRSSMYQQNLLAQLPMRPAADQQSISSSHITSLTGSELDDDPNYAQIPGHDPPYERVRCRSEHSYETLRKKSLVLDLESETGSVKNLSDKDSVGYESVKDEKNKESGYEIVKERNHEYETVKDKDVGYETVKDKDAGYETVKDSPDHGYETVREPGRHHGYETLKPRPPPPRSESAEITVTSDAEDAVPDILQNLSTSNSPTPEVPPEVLALYARVDKTKKRRRNDNEDDAATPRSSEEFFRCSKSSITPPAPPPLSPVNPPIGNGSCSTNICDAATEVNDGQGGVHVARDIIRRFNKLNSDEEVPCPRSRQGSITSETGTLRPLPPLPRESNSSSPPPPP